ncbi:MAG: branched-chain amino acid ABC transporter permease [Actinomycetota bacterium]|jgi:branched-chain amino acid transport system permease protein|nr:branched-chain amino acid ABC transporter permease [Actinomycetota bacterium]
MRRGVLKFAPLAIGSLVVACMPLLVDDRYLLKVLSFVAINVVIVTGLALLFGYAGQISLGHAAFYGIGAYASGYATTTLGLPWIVGLIAAILLSALGGVLLALPSLRLKGHYLAMATLGFGEIMRIAFVEAQPITGGPDGLGSIPYPSIGSFEMSAPVGTYLLAWGAAGLTLLLATNIVRQRPGRAMRALHGSELGAMACGIDIVGLKVRVFTVSAVLAGVAGSLYAHLVGFVSPSTFSLHFSVILIAMAVLGGSGSLAGPFVATALLTLLPFADAIIPGLSRDALALIQDWEADVYGLIIILVMLFAPGGVAGMLRRRRRGAGVRP